MNNSTSHSILEEMFLNNSYQEAVSYFEEHIDELKPDSFIGEIVSASYIELKQYDKALKHIDDNIKLVKDENIEDYAMFLIMKMEVMQYTFKSLKEYLLLQEYKKIDGIEKEDFVLFNEEILEAIIFKKYKKGLTILTIFSTVIGIFSRTFINFFLNSFIYSISSLMIFLIIYSFLFEKNNREVLFKFIKQFLH